MSIMTFCFHIRRRKFHLQEPRHRKLGNSVLAEQRARRESGAVGTVVEQAAGNPAVGASVGSPEGHRPWPVRNFANQSDGHE